jgi:hypothetical protein
MLTVQEEGRRCIVCGARLSIYNPSNKCFCHSETKEKEPNDDYICSSPTNPGRQIVLQDYYGCYADE